MNPPAGAQHSTALWTSQGAGRDVVIFLVITFGFAWILWGYWVVAMPPGGLVITPAFIVCAIVGGLAPSLAAMAVALLRDGRAGVVALLATLGRAIARPYLLLILVTVPAATLLTCIVQQLAGLQLRWPDPALLMMALIWPIMAALGEEFGWRAFLTARLIPALGLLPTALTVGLIWGLWHLPADYVGLKGYGELFWLAFLINGPILLTGHALIMTWLWQRTASSTLGAVLYHWTITASAMLAPAVASEGMQGLVAAGIGAAAIWAVAIGLWMLRPPANARRQR